MKNVAGISYPEVGDRVAVTVDGPEARGMESHGTVMAVLDSGRRADIDLDKASSPIRVATSFLKFLAAQPLSTGYSPPGTLNEKQQQVLLALYEAGDNGLTDFEYLQRINLKQTAAGPRCAELKHMGLVEWTGKYRMSDTQSRAGVRRLTATGRQTAAAIKKRRAA